MFPALNLSRVYSPHLRAFHYFQDKYHSFLNYTSEPAQTTQPVLRSYMKSFLVHKRNFVFWKHPSFTSASHFKKGRTTVQKFLTVFTTSSLTSLYFTFVQAHPVQAAVFDGFIGVAKKVFPDDEKISNFMGYGIPLLIGLACAGSVAVGLYQDNRNQDSSGAFRLALGLFASILILEITFKKLYG